MKKRIKTGYQEHMCDIFHAYVEKYGNEVDLDDVFDFATENELWGKPKIALRSIFKREMSKSLSSEKFEDEEGNTVRRNHAFRIKDGDRQMYLWNDILSIKPEPMKMCLQQRRLVLAARAI